MDFDDALLDLEYNAISSQVKVLKLKFRLMQLQRLSEIGSDEFNFIELAKVKALLDLLGQSHEL